nr:hypothetical protein [Anaerolineae bacterium]
MSQSRPAKSNALHELGYKIFLDRYAQKDMNRSTLAVGDTVIVVVNSQTGQREIGKVTALNLPRVTVTLNDGEVVTHDLEHVDKPLETDPAQMMDRVAAGIAGIEAPEKRREWTEKFRWLLEDWKFVPGGRILTGAGTDQELTYYNCLPPQQEILTDEGYKPIADVQVGDRVVTHRNRLRRVLHRFERETHEVLYLLRAQGVGYDALRVTGEHKIFLRRAEDAGAPQWVPAREARPGDYVALAYPGERRALTRLLLTDYIGLETLTLATAATGMAVGAVAQTAQPAPGMGPGMAGAAQPNNTLTLDADLCELFGRWLAGGAVTHEAGTGVPAGIHLPVAPGEDAATMATAFEAAFGVPAYIQHRAAGPVLAVDSLPVGAFFKAFLGGYEQAKALPPALLALPDALTLALLRGLFGGRRQMVLAGRTLAIQVQMLLLRLGGMAQVASITTPHSHRPVYRLTADDTTAALLAGVAAPAAGDAAALVWVPLETIATEDYTGQVLDIEVEEDHSFVSAGMVVSNCYVVPSPHDSRGGIMETLSQMTEIMSRGGGVGINISTLRPRHAYVKGVNGRSSGSVSWGALYSFVTGLIEQGGSRRGALMLILNDWHPDIFTFINSKRKAGNITNANISVGVSDKLMEAIQRDEPWPLMFPDTGDPDYDELWDGDLETWLAAGRRVITYKTVPARELWHAIIESAWASAEPGIWFRERSNKMANSWYFNPLISTNPCGEQPLGAWSVCNLGALNLAVFYDERAHDVDWPK